MELNRAGEDYLKAMLLLQEKKGEVRSAEVARTLNVTRASTSKAVHVLMDRGFLTMDRRKRICLTEAGRQAAEETLEKHRVIREILSSLGVEPETAEEDACRIEHDLSRQSFDRVKQFWEQHRENTG